MHGQLVGHDLGFLWHSCVLSYSGAWWLAPSGHAAFKKDHDQRVWGTLQHLRASCDTTSRSLAQTCMD